MGRRSRANAAVVVSRALRPAAFVLLLAGAALAADDPPVPPAGAPAPAATESRADLLARIDRLRRDGDLAGALEATERVLAAARDDLDLHVRRQDLLVALGRKEQALAIYRDHAAGAPADARRVYLVARLLAGEASLREMRRACELDPLLAPGWTGISDLLAARGAWRESADALQRAADLLRDAATLNSLGRLRERAGQIAEAIAAYRAALAAEPSWSLARRNLAYALVRGGSSDEALRLLEEALARDPADALTLVAAGWVKASRKDFEGARAAYEAALLAAPDAAVLGMLGAAYLGLERKDLAEHAFRRALTLSPDDPVAHLQLGRLRLEAGDAEAAEKEFKAALRSRGGASEAAYLLGLLCERAGRDEEAVAWYRKAAEAEPGNAAFAAGLAAALERRGRYPEAVTWYRRAAEASPDDAAPLFGAGAVLARLKRWKEAEDALAAALSLRPREARIHFYLGVVQADGRRDLEKARACFQKYVDLGGDPAAVKPWFQDVVRNPAPGDSPK